MSSFGMRLARTQPPLPAFSRSPVAFMMSEAEQQPKGAPLPPSKFPCLRFGHATPWCCTANIRSWHVTVPRVPNHSPCFALSFGTAALRSELALRSRPSCTNRWRYRRTWGVCLRSALSSGRKTPTRGGETHAGIGSAPSFFFLPLLYCHMLLSCCCHATIMLLVSYNYHASISMLRLVCASISSVEVHSFFLFSRLLA